MSERRYNEDEIAAIFANAARPAENAPRRPASSAGMTLAELQDIGREVGLSESDVARAAAALDTTPRIATGRFLGVPLAVGRTVELPRLLTDAEWEQLVVDLRTTFRARGHLTAHGSLREWYNGNLHALVEPTPSGYQLRLGTMKESARNSMVGGVATLGGAAALLVLDVLTGAGVTPAAGLLAGAGALMFGTATARLPRWLKLRRRQFDAIATRLLDAMHAQAGPQATQLPDAGAAADAAVFPGKG